MLGARTMRHQTAVIVTLPTSYSGEDLRVYVEAPDAPRAARLLSYQFSAVVLVEVGARVYLTYRDGDLVRAARYADYYISREDGRDREEQLTVELLEINELSFSEVYTSRKR